VKRDGHGALVAAASVGVLCLVVAIGAGLQGQFVFGGPRWTPGMPQPPVAPHTQLPQPAVSATASAKPTTIDPGIVFSWLPILIALTVLVIAVVLLLILYWIRRRRRNVQKGILGVENTFGDVADGADLGSDADLPALHRGLLRAAELLESHREPRDAIIRAWIGLQEAAEDSGLSRRPAETPTEFTSRVFASVDADRAAAAALLEVYLRVRFRSSPATESDATIARDAIARLRETWPARTSG
jgi:Domain of unknown function (DUF4129)